MLSMLTDGKMEDKDIQRVVLKVLDEVDTKKNGSIEPQDFRNIMMKSTNFAQNLCIRF